MKNNEYKDTWICKMIQKIIVMTGGLYEQEKINFKETGLSLKQLRENLCILRKEINTISYTYYVKMENGLSCINRKTLYKILSEFYDIAEAKHDIVERILWPIEESAANE